MIVMMTLGAALGEVLFWLVVQFAPPKTGPLVQLGRLDAALAGSRHTVPTPAVFYDNGRRGREMSGRIGAVVAGHLTRRGITYTSLRQDLALSGRTFEATMGRKVVAFVVGFLLALTVTVALTTTGLLAFPVGSPALVAVGAGFVFFFLPDVDARTVATKRRRDFRRALGAYLDLVALEMAGSAAPAEALPKAAQVGSGWPLALLRDTLYRATRSGTDPWEALADLGTRIGVTELRDLGQLVKLVAHDGAKVRHTLTARAATMRRRELAHAQGQAGERDQSMRLAQIVLGFGFIFFLGYPAVVAILNL